MTALQLDGRHIVLGLSGVTMQALSNRPAVTSQWEARADNNMAHIKLTREADAVLVAPASADFIAKLAQGRADELLSLLCLARRIDECLLLVAPAMNREMWAHPATQRNVAQIEAGERGGDPCRMQAGRVDEDFSIQLHRCFAAHLQHKA